MQYRYFLPIRYNSYILSILIPLRSEFDSEAGAKQESCENFILFSATTHIPKSNKHVESYGFRKSAHGHRKIQRHNET
jgi:hypothetical protein